MKAILAAVFVLASRAIAANYTFESLVDEAAQHVAPAAIQQTMARIESEGMRISAEVHHFSPSALASYFSAVPIDLGDKTLSTYLVFPSRYSAAFFGAHAIRYWILQRRANGRFTLLLSGGSDRIEILSKRSHGLFDIDSFYGNSVSHLRFDGNAYQGEKG